MRLNSRMGKIFKALGIMLISGLMGVQALDAKACGSCSVSAPNGCGTGCGISCNSSQPGTLFTHNINSALACSGSKTVVFGWLQSGITVNEHGATQGYGANPITSPASRQLDPHTGNGYLLGTEQQTDYKLSQLWFGAMRSIDNECGIDWGYRVDSVYGTDARYCQSFGDDTFDSNWGSGDYYFAFTQMYVELGNKNAKLKVGKFVTDMSHEPIAAPGTYFYSHSYACYSSPLHVSGVVGDVALGKKFRIMGGWTAGYHTSFANRFEDNGFFGKLTYTPNKCMSLAYNIYAGRNNGYKKKVDALNYGRDYDTADVLAQTIVFNWTISKKWRYMLEGHWSNYSYKEGLGGDYSANAQGINQHLIYTVNDKLSFGGRFEWIKTRNGFFDLGPITGGEGCDIFEVTFGSNWNPVPWLNIRPEIRYDWTDYANNYKAFGDGNKSNQLSVGIGTTIIF